MKRLIPLIYLAGILIFLAFQGMAGERMHLEAKEAVLITVYDNYPFKPGLQPDWGFSCLIKTGNHVLLFDTGSDSGLLLENMEKLGIKPEDIDTVFISHPHSDHYGGLFGFLERNPNVTVWLLASFPDAIKREIAEAGAEVREIDGPEKIAENLASTGELGGWLKEQSLLLMTPRGLVVITGCAHPGIVHIIRKAKELTGEDPYLVLGGFHLFSASNEEILSIISEFKDLGVKKVAPCHCSGDRARELFQEAFGDDFILNGVGRIIEI